MKNVLTTLGLFVTVLGFLIVAGSAGDCDGKCVELANDIPTMLMAALIGFVGITAGVSLTVLAQRNL